MQWTIRNIGSHVPIGKQQLEKICCNASAFPQGKPAWKHWFRSAQKRNESKDKEQENALGFCGVRQLEGGGFEGGSKFKDWWEWCGEDYSVQNVKTAYIVCYALYSMLYSVLVSVTQICTTKAIPRNFACRWNSAALHVAYTS